MPSKGSLAVLIPEFPGQTHIFFWREIQALRQSGNTVKIISTRAPKEKNYHEFFQEIDDTFYLTPLRYFQVACFLLVNISWLFKALRYCLSLDGGALGKFKALLFVPVAANLALHCKESSISHVHVHSSANAAHVAAIASLTGDFTYSVCIHGNLNQYGDNHRAKLSRAAFIVTVTRPLQEEIFTTLPEYPRERVFVLPMGVDVGKFLPREYADSAGNRIVLTSISRLAYVKGHTFALQALARLPPSIDFLYQIVGDGEMREQLEKEVQSLGLEKKVVFLGFQKEGDVYQILRNTDIFMLTSFGFGEAAPVAIMEAMACGVAPICSIIGGTRDMITDGHDGLLVEQKNVQAIKNAILTLISNRRKLAEIGANARNTAQVKFCHQKSANILDGCISQCSTIETGLTSVG